MSNKILITGVSSGIGAGLARYFLEAGGLVWGMSRRRPEPMNLCDGFNFRSVDFSNHAMVGRAVRQLIAEVDGFDLVVLNAGVLNGLKDMSETGVEEIERVMGVNVWSHKVLLDVLFADGVSVRQVVGISSGAAVSGSRGWNAYALSKACLNMLIKLYAGERADTHFSALAPGLVDTAMQDYICGLKPDERFPVAERLRQARGSEAMPRADDVAPRLVAAFKKLLEYPSGEFVDLREIK